METRRLFTRPPRLADVPDLFDFLGDPEAMRFTQCDQSLPACRRRIAVHEWMRRKNGYAPWVIVAKDSGEKIGWGGLYEDPFDPGWGIELAYFFHPSVWGQGLGLEFAEGALEYADAGLNTPEISAFAHPDNIASASILKKAGFKEIRFINDMERILFCRKRP